jgi:hypothetical protein
MAKLADVYVRLFSLDLANPGSIGRGETFIIVTILYVVGYVSDGIPLLSFH